MLGRGPGPVKPIDEETYRGHAGRPCRGHLVDESLREATNRQHGNGYRLNDRRKAIEAETTDETGLGGCGKHGARDEIVDRARRHRFGDAVHRAADEKARRRDPPNGGSGDRIAPQMDAVGP